MDYNLLLGILALLVTAYGVHLTRLQTQMMLAQSAAKRKRATVGAWWKSPPIVVLSLLVVLAWIPYFISLATLLQIPNEGQASGAVTGWGGAGPGHFYVRADGDYLFKYRSRYRLVGFCLLLDGLRDPKDVAFFGKTGTYDIRPGSIEMGIQYNIAELEGKTGTMNFGLLLVPDGLNPSSFSTVREAQELGAKFIWKGAVGG